MLLGVNILALALITPNVAYNLKTDGDARLHRRKRDITNDYSKKYNVVEEASDYWINQAQITLKKQILKNAYKGSCKNVILFLGDGMSIPTLTAARAYLAQTMNKTGEELKLSFERFPYTGLSKTYCVDQQVADSACSSTAYLCGVKANEGTIGVTAAVQKGDCKASQDQSTHVESIARWFQKEGKSTGFVTTTRVTHASPAGLCANTAHRDWESDSDLKNSNNNVYACTDIADQLINGPVGKNFHVILGGGAAKFLPTTAYDSDGIQGNRTDGRNLIQEWQSQNESVRQFIWNKARLLNISSNVKHLLGLFSSDHMPFNLERDTLKVPSLAEMTESAIKLLSQNTDGYFLFVEGGRIDHAHHKSQARKALDETVQFHEAVKAALHITNRHDTLIITTSDHAHTMSINGYPLRGNDILGIGGIADDDLPYTTLTYANGPGYRMLENGHRQNVSNDNFDNQNYAYSAGFPLVEETHGGEDVAIFALGPWAHLFVGVLEQNVIPHIMAFASCVGNGIKACDVNVNTN